MAKLNPYEMVSFSSWKGISLENHFNSLAQTSPQLATTQMIRLLEAKRKGNYLEGILSKFPTKVFDNDTYYYWHVVGAQYVHGILVEARDKEGQPINVGTFVGTHGDEFYLVFREDVFAKGEMIVGELNEEYPILIKEAAVMEGSNAVYKCELYGNVQEFGMPYEELVEGKRFSAEYNPVPSELSREAGDVRFTSASKMENEWSTLRLQHKVPGSAMDRKLAIGLPFQKEDGSIVVNTMWMQHVEWTVEKTFSEQKNRCLMFGVSNRNSNGEYVNIDSRTGMVIKTGDGLRKLQSYNGTIYYTDFSLSLIEKALYDITDGTDEIGGVFLMKTGKRGAALFNRAVMDKISGWERFELSASDLGIVKRTNSNLHDTALSVGYQFTEYRAPMGIIVKLEVDPMYDDPERNKLRHPLGGLAESYRFDIYKMGSKEIPNVQLAANKMHPEQRGYQSGFRNPYTGKNNIEFMSTDEDSAKIHRYWQGGVICYDMGMVKSLVPCCVAG